MPIPAERFYQAHQLHKWFAISSILMTGSLIWMVCADYDRPWRDFQDRHSVSRAALAHLDYLEATSPERIDELEQARQQLADLERLRDRERGAEREHFAARLAEARLQSEKAGGTWRRAVEEHQVSRGEYERALERNGPDHPETINRRKQCRRAEAAAEELRHRKERGETEVESLQHVLDEIDRPVIAAEKQVRQLEQLRDDALEKDRRYRGVLSDSGVLRGWPILRTIVNFPLFDFVAPRNTPGRHQINQVVLSEVPQQLHYLETYTTERCTTCHLAMDEPDFTQAGLARALEAALPTINETLEHLGRPRVGYPAPPGNGSDDGSRLEVGHVTDHWETLRQGERDRYFALLLKAVNQYLEATGRRPIRLEPPVPAHPHPELYVSAESAHPQATMGCTVCHEGNPQETDFVLAAHTSPDRETTAAWEDRYYVRRLGIPQATLEDVSDSWDRPMLPARYIEAGCAKCHFEISDLSRFGMEGFGVRLDLGRLLFTSLGCINCHTVDTIPDSRRVGPDLTSLASKTTRLFVRPWILDPYRFRPSTRMPHFFDQENNRPEAAADVDPDPRRRSEAEVLAIAKYLFAVSREFDAPAPPDEVVAKSSWGRGLFKSRGCPACHANMARFGEHWFAREAAPEDGPDGEPGLDRYQAMSYEQRVRYAMGHFPGHLDAVFEPDQVRVEPARRDELRIFTRFAPELSGVGSKTTFAWLYSWLIDPSRYAPDTRMPNLRLTSEATHIAAYVMTLKNDVFLPDDVPLDDTRREMAEQLLTALLSAQLSAPQARAIMQDESGRLTDMLVDRLTDSRGAVQARELADAMSLEEKRLVLLGGKMITHYGCYACHKIPGFEKTALPGTELSEWAEKPVSRLYLAYFAPGFEDVRRSHPGVFDHVYPLDADRLIHRAHGQNPDADVNRTHASYATHKLLNPRIWDRLKPKAPYEKFRMPNFYLSENEVEGLVTFLLSRRSSCVGRELRVDYVNTPAGMIAAGRSLARELNCVACHEIDGNVALIQQYFPFSAGGEREFDDAPPSLHGAGAKLQSSWLYGFLDEAERIRPWYEIRMPSFHLDDEQRTRLMRYLVGLSRDESGWLAERLGPVHEYVQAAQEEAAEPIDAGLHSFAGDTPGAGEDQIQPGISRPGDDWFQQESLADAAESLRQYALANRLVTPELVDPETTGTDAYAAAHETILGRVESLRKLLDVTYPAMDVTPASISPEEMADGEAMFRSLQCMACHVFMPPRLPREGEPLLAPDLRPAYRRLRREWVRKWLENPQRMLPLTYMPDMFGDGSTSPFTAWSAADRERLEANVRDKEALDDAGKVIAAITDFLFHAGPKQPSGILPKTAPPG